MVNITNLDDGPEPMLGECGTIKTKIERPGHAGHVRIYVLRQGAEGDRGNG